MKTVKTDNAEAIVKPAYEIVRTKLREEVVDTRPLNIIISRMAQIQQQVAARHEAGAFWSGENSLPIDGAIFVGDSGCGKSLGLRYAMHTLPPILLSDGTEVPSNPLYVDTPSQGTVGALAKATIRAADGAEMREPKDRDAPGKAIAALDRHKFSILVIDEISRIFNPARHFGRGLETQSHLVWTLTVEALNLQTAPTPVVMSGLPRSLDTFMIRDKDEKALEVRREAQRRMNVVVLPDLDINADGEMLEKAIKDYCNLAGVGSVLAEKDYILSRLIHASVGQAGTALEWIQKAVALAAVRPNGKLNRGDFAFVYGHMTSAADMANPFLSSDWLRLDIGKVAPQTFAEAVGKEKAA